MINIIQNRKIWITLSSVVVLVSLFLLAVFGLNFGIDFTGGSLLEVDFSSNRPSVVEVNQVFSGKDFSSLVVQPVGETGMILRFQEISEEKHQEAIKTIRAMVDNDNYLKTEKNATGTPVDNQAMSKVEELRFDSVGPSIGQELKTKSLYAIILVLLTIVAYIAWVFRKVSKPISSWKYGVVANVALFHDVIITLGAFAVMGKFFGVEINTPFVAAILTVLGYSVNDSIVVFDRIRENLPKSDDTFENTVNKSLNETISRSINTSLTTLLVLLSIFFFGGDTIKAFVLALSIGVFVGTYSSIFLASPLLVVWERFKNK